MEELNVIIVPIFENIVAFSTRIHYRNGQFVNEAFHQDKWNN